MSLWEKHLKCDWYIVQSMSFSNLFRRISGRERGNSRGHSTISLPSNFEHRAHVIIDQESGKYIGLPPQWVSLMNNKIRQTPRRTVSSPDLRQHQPSNKQNGVPRFNSHVFSDQMNSSLPRPRRRNSFQNDQESTIERLKVELRDYKARTSPVGDRTIENYSWPDGPSTLPRVNGKSNAIMRGNGRLKPATPLPSQSIPTSINRSESSVWHFLEKERFEFVINLLFISVKETNSRPGGDDDTGSHYGKSRRYTYKREINRELPPGSRILLNVLIMKILSWQLMFWSICMYSWRRVTQYYWIGFSVPSRDSDGRMKWHKYIFINVNISRQNENQKHLKICGSDYTTRAEGIHLFT
jgi:hypothetical protein